MACAEISWRVRDYDLGATLESGQAFRWQRVTAGQAGAPSPVGRAVPGAPGAAGEGPPALPGPGSWEGVIGSRWVRLSQAGEVIRAETALAQESWGWLTHYLQLEVELDRILETFPPDPPLLEAVAAYRGLRLLRQEPWECLASFILSSTKQIVQIRQIIAALCERYGEPVVVPAGVAPCWQFPTAHRLAGGTEAELRACKAGFRAPYLLAAARQVAEGRIGLDGLAQRPLAEARAALMALPGVGRKIADCVLLFAGGFPRAFPVDIWVLRALRELYPECRRLPPRRLVEFGETHFGPHGGYAQQYLFHFRRVRRR